MSNRRRGPYRSGIERRDRIIASAIEVFSEYGYNVGSLRMIGERAGGITPAAVMRHFESKEELFIEVLEHWDAFQIQADREYGGLEYFRWLSDVTAYNEQHRGFIELYLTLSMEAREPSHPGHQFMIERQMRTVASFERHLQQAIDDGDISPMTSVQLHDEARTLLAVFDGLALQASLNPSMEFARLIDNYVALAVERWRIGVASPLGSQDS